MFSIPKLDEGRIYRRCEVEEYIGTQAGTSDYDVMNLHFPRNLETWEHDPQGWRDDEEVLLQFQIYPMAIFKQCLWELKDVFSRNEEHQRRVDNIIDIFLKGRNVYPVFLQENDPQRRIVEGMHRAVALLALESYCLPVFLAGYRSWFGTDGSYFEFEREDEIVSASLEEAMEFFNRVICIDHKGRWLAIFDPGRLQACDDVIVAKYQGRIIGAATMSIAKGLPTLSTVYVMSKYRRKGVAYRLSREALLRFNRAGINGIFL